jgi:hypothetical protein
MLVPDLDRDLTGVARRQPIPPDLSRRAGRLVLGGIKALKLQAVLIRDEARSFPHIEIKTRLDFPWRNKEKISFPA